MRPGQGADSKQASAAFSSLKRSQIEGHVGLVPCRRWQAASRHFESCHLHVTSRDCTLDERHVTGKEHDSLADEPILGARPGVFLL